MSNNHILKSLLLAVIMIAGCKPELKELKFDNNSIDFSKYVAIGSSYTAGYQNNALFDMGQQNSFAAILASQLKKLAVASFCNHWLAEMMVQGSTFFFRPIFHRQNLAMAQHAVLLRASLHFHPT